ncbi:hypothetical protein AD998_10315 [bacterium 336/3]|nr:hypothetical protein AD998_10315 [bacterium 336/3]
MENQNEKVIFKIDNELTYFKLVALLEANKIWYIARRVENNLYPSLNFVGIYGEITVLEQDSEKVESFLEKKEYSDSELSSEITENNCTNTEIDKAPKAKKNRTQTFLVIYAIVMTLVALRYWYANKNYQEDKNYTYHWNIDATALKTVLKKSSDVTTISYDRNYDLNFEKSVGYVKGYKSSETFDSNENGIIERMNLFNNKGDLVGYSINVDEDFSFEQSCIILENKDTLYLLDKDRNCMFEELKVVSGKK